MHLRHGSRVLRNRRPSAAARVATGPVWRTWPLVVCQPGGRCAIVGRMKSRRIGIVGGGAAGFFAALACAETQSGAEIFVLEKTSQFLSKVKISGGGRCNVTHACFDEREFATALSARRTGVDRAVQAISGERYGGVVRRPRREIQDRKRRPDVSHDGFVANHH